MAERTSFAEHAPNASLPDVLGQACRRGDADKNRDDTANVNIQMSYGSRPPRAWAGGSVYRGAFSMFVMAVFLQVENPNVVCKKCFRRGREPSYVSVH